MTERLRTLCPGQIPREGSNDSIRKHGWFTFTPFHGRRAHGATGLEP